MIAIISKDWKKWPSTNLVSLPVLIGSCKLENHLDTNFKRLIAEMGVVITEYNFPSDGTTSDSVGRTEGRWASPENADTRTSSSSSSIWTTVAGLRIFR
jgi:hypothetical protein